MASNALSYAADVVTVSCYGGGSSGTGGVEGPYRSPYGTGSVSFYSG